MQVPMQPELWSRMERIFHAALEMEPERRRQFIRTECGDDRDLEQQIESLLENDDLLRSGPGTAPLRNANPDPVEAGHDEPGSDRLPAPAWVLAPGDLVSSYRVVSRIGRGGMGEVYLAEDTQLGRRVALKILRGQVAGDLRREAGFLREARAASALDHPNIAAIYGIEETSSGQRCIVMAYYEGQSLAEKIRTGGALLVPEAAEIAIQIALGLAEAHAHRIVHRDIKPSNILITRQGLIKVIDFGIARALQSSTATLSATVAGTPCYMSPEQAQGKPVDERTDLWSLGTVLYEMITGRRAFAAADVPATLFAIVYTPPAIAGEVPEGMQRIIQRALAKRPEDRYQTAAEMIADLRASVEVSKRASGVTTRTKRRPIPEGIARAAHWLHTRLGAGGHPEPQTVRAVPATVSRRAAVAGLSLGTLTLAGLAVLLLRQGKPEQSIAVLPFANLSSDSGTDYFSDGITEELIGALTKISELRVVARDSVFRFNARPHDLRRIRRELHVRWLLTGSVRVSGARLRISAQLVNAADGYQLWSETYERDSKDLFAIQEDIARTIATTLQVRMATVPVIPSGARTPNLEAHDLYLRGRYHWNQRSPVELGKALDFFERAITQDPHYAQAYSGIADTYSTLFDYGELPAAEGVRKAKAAALEALRLDKGLAEAHASLAWLTTLYDWDWPAAEAGFRTAIELNPGYAAGHYWYAALLSCLGRFPESVAEVRRARDLDPLSPSVNANLGWMLLYARQYGAAAEEAKRALALDQNFIYAHHLLAEAYARTGAPQEAIQECRLGAELSGNQPLSVATLGLVYALLGQQREAGRIAELLKAKRATGSVPACYLAAIYGALGSKDDAFRWLDTAYEERDRMLLWIKVSPAYDALRNDRRYIGLLAKLRLTP